MQTLRLESCSLDLFGAGRAGRLLPVLEALGRSGLDQLGARLERISQGS